MAQGGHHLGLDEEESEDTEDFVPLPFMDPFVMGLKKEGDEKFQAKQYEEAAAIYTMAMHRPMLFPFMDTSVIAEKLFRKRATCFFKMGEYLEAIQDSERAIELADCMNNKNLLAKSIFIKMKAVVSLGDFVPALPLAVWCKHLRPNCDKTKTFLKDLKENLRDAFKKANFVVKAVLLTMLRFAEQMGMDYETRELALECYTELLELLDFMHLPGVLLKQAECLLNLGRCNEAKDICANVLWLHRGHPEALKLMSEITQRLKEKERKQPEETVESQASLSKEEPEENKANDDTTLNSEDNDGEFDVVNLPHITPTNDSTNVSPNDPTFINSPAGFPIENTEEQKTDDDALLNAEEKKECSQVKEESAVAGEPNVQEKMAGLEHIQGEDAAANDHADTEKKRKKNKKKKMRKKAKKKAQQKNDDFSDQAPVNNINNDESPDEDDSQATDSVMGDPDVGLSYSDFDNTLGKEKASFGTLPITLSMLEANKDEESDDGDFVTVRNTRRTAKSSEITQDVQNQFGARVSGLDWIGTPCGNHRSSGHESRTKPNPEGVDDSSQSRTRQSPFSSTAKTVEKPHPDVKIKASHVSSTMSKAPQLQEISPRLAPGVQANESQNKPEVPTSLRLDEFLSLGGESVQRPTHNPMSASGIPWSNCKVPDASSVFDASVSNSKRVYSETPTRERIPEQSQITPGQISGSTGISWSQSHGQSERSSTPTAFSQNLQTNTTARKHSADPPPGFSFLKNIPDGVFVVCDHFLQDNRRRPASIYEATKTCKFCEKQGWLKYATWNKSHFYWQVMRPYPVYKVPPRAVFDVCRHFASDRPCPKEPCTFPHGKQETIMWTLEREGREYINFM
ncbi:hypothetical protein ACROYT_G038191 [Oculina patagonica]